MAVTPQSALAWLTAALIATASAEPATSPAEPPPAARPGNPLPSPELRAAIGKLQLPGLRINVEKWSVDVESTVCLDDGPLELIACTKDGKVHESIIAVAAKPSHIHAALLLLGTKPGSPATRKPIDPEGLAFIDIPPHGGPVEVSLVTRNDDGTESEKPIRDFIVANKDFQSNASEDPDSRRFPTSTFLFAGSVLLDPKEPGAPRRYLSDLSGNLISISTFGDETLCLPDVHSQENHALLWRIDSGKLPPLDSPITLRLKPLLGNPTP